MDSGCRMIATRPATMAAISVPASRGGPIDRARVGCAGAIAGVPGESAEPMAAADSLLAAIAARALAAQASTRLSMVAPGYAAQHSGAAKTKQHRAQQTSRSALRESPRRETGRPRESQNTETQVYQVISECTLND